MLAQGFWHTSDHVQALSPLLSCADNTSLRNPAGFVIRALEENWMVGSGSRSVADSNRYITGKYAAFIEH